MYFSVYAMMSFVTPQNLNFKLNSNAEKQERYISLGRQKV
jgi:hypothetical protein